MAAMKPHGTPKRRQSAEFTLTYEQAQGAHTAMLEYLLVHDVTVCSELVTGKYSPNSQLDCCARLAIRMSRYLLGGEHYNHRIGYGGQAPDVLHTASGTRAAA